MTLDIHPTAKISRFADIEDSTRGTLIRIGAGCTIDSFVKIKPAGGTGDLIIGDNTIINSGCVLYTGNGLVIGKSCAIAANCTLAPVNHQFLSRTCRIMDQGFMPSRGGIFIGDDVWIGANSLILDGSRIETGAVVAGGSVVRQRLEAYGVYAGAPPIKKRERE
jgi:virginiamycin A acetyltransferase